MTDLQETLRRLASPFVARDIMRPVEQLKCACAENEARKLFDENPWYDVIPLLSGGKLLSFVERGQPCPSLIEVEHLVGAGTPIPDVVDSLCKRRYCFVVGRHEAIGFIHFSDLNDPVVKLPFFVLLEGVERRFADDLRGLVKDEVLARLIRDQKRLDALRAKMAKLRVDGAERDWVTLLYFREILGAAIYFGKLSLEVAQVEELSAVRTRVAHAATDELVERHEDVKRLSRVRELSLRLLLDGQPA